MNETAQKENRDCRFTFRMTKKEAALLNEAAKKLSWKTSDFARIAVSAAVVATDQTLPSD